MRIVCDLQTITTLLVHERTGPCSRLFADILAQHRHNCKLVRAMIVSLCHAADLAMLADKCRCGGEQVGGTLSEEYNRVTPTRIEGRTIQLEG